MAIDIPLRNSIRRKVKALLQLPGADDLTITKIVEVLLADGEFTWDGTHDSLRDLIDKIVDEIYSSSPQSVFREITLQHTMQLLPHNMKKPSRAIMLNLNDYLMKYNHDFNGVMISYRNIRLLDKLGKIIDDQPFVHIRVSFKALLFSPYPGCMLKGEVKYLGEDHIALVVLGAFNASILDVDLKEIDKASLEHGDWLSFCVKSVDGVVGSMKITGETNADCTHVKGAKLEEEPEAESEGVATEKTNEEADENEMAEIDVNAEEEAEEEAARIQNEVEAEYHGADAEPEEGAASEETEDVDASNLMDQSAELKEAEEEEEEAEEAEEEEDAEAEAEAAAAEAAAKAAEAAAIAAAAHAKALAEAAAKAKAAKLATAKKAPAKATTTANGNGTKAAKTKRADAETEEASTPAAKKRKLDEKPATTATKKVTPKPAANATTKKSK